MSYGRKTLKNPYFIGLFATFCPFRACILAPAPVPKNPCFTLFLGQKLQHFYNTPHHHPLRHVRGSGDL